MASEFNRFQVIKMYTCFLGELICTVLNILFYGTGLLAILPYHNQIRIFLSGWQNVHIYL